MSGYETEDLVVFLPGITGSVLKHHGSTVWGPSTGAIFRAVVTGGRSIKRLALEAEDDPSLDDLGDGVEVAGLVPDAHVVPGLWKIDGYTKLTRTIEEAFGLERGKDSFHFAYDWRRDNRASARLLGEALKGWIHARRREHPGAKAVLVGHSMGGLVARYYLEVLGGWEDVRTLVTFGTPFGGSLNALDYMVRGHRKGIGPFKVDLSELMRSFTSIHQLLPTYPCVDPGDGELRGVDRVDGLPHTDPERVRRGLAFHDEIARAVRARGGDTRDAQVVPVVGIEQPTSQAARFVDGELEILRERKTDDGRWTDEGGDGTVPRISAVPFEMVGERREVYAAEAHGSLQNHDAVLAHLRGVLSAPDFAVERKRPGPPIALSLEMDDACALPAPVRFEVRASSDTQPDLVGTLTTAEGDEVARAPLRKEPDGAQWGAFVAPEEGLYRLRVGGMDEDAARVASVTDLVLVARDVEPEGDG
jgi:pimeloyl-ACP methyl ester carboxylesterase